MRPGCYWAATCLVFGVGFEEKHGKIAMPLGLYNTLEGWVGCISTRLVQVGIQRIRECCTARRPEGVFLPCYN